MDWSKYGKYDFVSAVEYIRSNDPKNQKVAMVGHSQGTTQTFAGMAQIPEWYDENVSVAALLGPCTSPSLTYLATPYTKENWDFLAENDIWVIDGPEWEEKNAIIQERGPQSLKDFIKFG